MSFKGAMHKLQDWTTQNSDEDIESPGAPLMADNVPSELSPVETQSQYFLSHKKTHSEHGLVPGQVARNIHDSLELLGHMGWFDTDDLGEITREGIRLAIRQCATMIVLFNNETADSEWCVYEWACAKEFGLPVRVVVDMERCSKAEALKLLGAAHNWMLERQLLEYTERYRRDTLAELSDFLWMQAPLSYDDDDSFSTGPDSMSESSVRYARRSHSDLGGRESSVRPARTRSGSGQSHKRPRVVTGAAAGQRTRKETETATSLTFGREKARRVIHARYEALSLLGGLPLRAVTSPAARAWITFVRFAQSATAGTLLMFMLFIHDGPFYQDFYFTGALLVYFSCLTYCSSAMVQVLHSDEVRQMLVAAEGGGTNEEIAGRIYRNTSRAAIGGFLSSAIVVFVAELFFARCLLDEHYIGKKADGLHRVAGFGVLMMLTLGYPFAAIVNVCYSSNIILLLSVSRTQVAAAFDELDPKLAEIGLERFAPHAPLTTLRITPSALVSFTKKWTVGVANYHVAHNLMLNVQRSWLVVSLILCAVPIELMLHGAPVSNSWYHLGTIVAAWFASVSTLMLTLRGCASCTRSLRKTQADARQIICDDSRVALRLWQLTQETDLTCYFGGCLPCTPEMLAVYFAAALVSGVPFLYLNYVG